MEGAGTSTVVGTRRIIEAVGEGAVGEEEGLGMEAMEEVYTLDNILEHAHLIASKYIYIYMYIYFIFLLFRLFDALHIYYLVVVVVLYNVYTRQRV